jgi:hypothetical protein
MTTLRSLVTLISILEAQIQQYGKSDSEKLSQPAFHTLLAGPTPGSLQANAAATQPLLADDITTLAQELVICAGSPSPANLSVAKKSRDVTSSGGFRNTQSHTGTASFFPSGRSEHWFPFAYHRQEDRAVCNGKIGKELVRHGSKQGTDHKPHRRTVQRTDKQSLFDIKISSSAQLSKIAEGGEKEQQIQD